MKASFIISLTKYLFLIFIILTGCRPIQNQNNIGSLQDEAIKPLPENPYYWQYKGEPVWLIGGSWQDNLFNHPTNLEEHLNILVSRGGNYVRNVMSHRNAGNVFAWQKNNKGLYDLDQFNDEYWNRLDNFLELTYERDIIVQLEIWATWDHYEDHQTLGGWSLHPFNPKNNITYTSENSMLPTVYDSAPQSHSTGHPFFKSVPALDNNELLLDYQKQYVDKILSYTFQYPHILYTMNNETGEAVEWGDFWVDYVRNAAEEKGIAIETTDMRRSEEIRSEDHAYIFDNPERYTFVDISQNNAWSGLGRAHYENILYVRDYLSHHPRPINNNKNYGASRHGEEESVARMGRILFAGAASARFHRPHPIEQPELHEAKSETGLGLNPRAQDVITALSKVTQRLAFEQMEPRPDLILTEDEAYLLAEPGVQYAVYFPFGGTAKIEITPADADYRFEWIQFDNPEWGHSGLMNHKSEGEIQFTTPDYGHWILVLQHES